MHKVKLVGDIHGKFMTYMNLVEGVYEDVNGGPRAERSVQIGDFGLGFGGEPDIRMPQWLEANPQHRFIRGNHDNPELVATTPGWIQDGLFDQHGVLYIGGAWSIDAAYRTPGKDWWFDEEVSTQKLNELCETFSELKPKIVITHDCPTWVAWEMFLKEQVRPYHVKTRTGEALQEMFETWKPEVWVFGHWHKTRKVNIDGTTFVCLGELAHMDVDFESAQIIGNIYARNRGGGWTNVLTAGPDSDRVYLSKEGTTQCSS